MFLFTALFFFVSLFDFKYQKKSLKLLIGVPVRPDVSVVVFCLIHTQNFQGTDI